MVFKIGAHVSISGGFSKALKREKEVGGNCGQIFVKSPRGWSFPDFDKEEAKKFRHNYKKMGMEPFVVHATYLINLATPKRDLFEKSIECLKGELEWADRLNLPYVIFHPGSHTGSGEAAGIKRIIEGLDRLEEKLNEIETQLLLENTAGKGTTLGYKMEQLQKMMENSKPDEIKVCFDTAHAFGAGYDLRTYEGVSETSEKIKETVGLDSIKIVHLNDSKASLGSKKDQHAHLTEGEIGREGVKAFINHPTFRDLPMVRETPFSPKDIKVAKQLREKG